MATIKDLPKELLVEIFTHYVRSYGHDEFSRNIPRVCKLWNELSTEVSLWRDVRTSEWSHLMNVSRRGLLEHTQSLELQYYQGYEYEFSDRDLSEVLKNIRHLRALVMPYRTFERSRVLELVAKYCPHLERFRFEILGSHNEVMSNEWNQFITARGHTLKHLELLYFGFPKAEQQHFSGTAAVCPLLEKLKLHCVDAPFSIHELRSGCPRLRELEFKDSNLIRAKRDDRLGSGFQHLKKLSASCSDFGGFDISTLLKDSTDLEHLILVNNRNLVIDVSRIPSENVKVLNIELEDPDKNFKVLEDAVWKWRRTLSFFKLGSCKRNISCVLQCYLRDNPNPQLESLVIVDEDPDPHLLEELIQKCKNLINLEINYKQFKGREKFKEALEFVMKGASETHNT